MPLLLNCSCGKQLRVPDEFAGKRIKCPACSEVLTVPEPAAAAYAGSGVTARPSPSSAAPAGGAIRFSCSCGKVMQARAEFAGRNTRCPACQSTLTIPGSGDAGQGIRDGLPIARKGSLAEDYDDEAPMRRVRRRGGRKPPWLWAGLAAGLLLLIGGGIGAYFLLFRGKIAADMALVPGDAQGFVTLRAADVWKLDLTQKLIKQAPIPGGGDPAAILEQAAGVRPEDVERVTLVMMDLQQQPSFAIVAGTKAFSKQTILDKLSKGSGVAAKDAEHKGKKYQTTGPGTALYFVDDKTLVIGEEKNVQRCIDHQASPKEPTGNLRDALKTASGRTHVVAWFQVPKGALGPGMGGGMGGPMIGPGAAIQSFADLKDFTAAVDLGNTIAVDLTLGFSDSSKADAARKQIDEGVKQFKQAMPMLKPMLAAQAKDAGSLIDAGEKALNTLSVSRKGDGVGISFRMDINPDALVAALKPMINQPLMGRPAPFPKR
jgi:hypothetical protein